MDAKGFPSCLGNHLDGLVGFRVFYVGDRYFGGDESNIRQKLAGYTTLDWQTHWQMRNWSVTAKLQNLTDKKYAALGYDYGFGASYYPANPLSAYLTVRHDFQ